MSFLFIFIICSNSMAIHHKDKNLPIEISIFTTSHYDPARCQSNSKNTSLSFFHMGGWDIIRKIQFKSLYAEILQIINHGLEVLYAPILQHSNARDYSRASFSNIKGILSSWKLSQFHFIIKLWKTSHTPILYFTHIKLVSEVKISKVY